jgi:hypothetical protein
MHGLSDLKAAIGPIKFWSLIAAAFAWLIIGIMFDNDLRSERCDYGRGMINLLKTLSCSPTLLDDGLPGFVQFMWLWYLPSWVGVTTVIWMKADR